MTWDQLTIGRVTRSYVASDHEVFARGALGSKRRALGDPPGAVVSVLAHPSTSGLAAVSRPRTAGGAYARV